MSLRRAVSLSVSAGVVASYVHNAAAPNMGKIGVLVALEGSAPADTLTALGKQLAMHIAAANPLALSEADLDPAVVERERGIAREKAASSGKPAEIIEKMIEGGIRKFQQENTLLGQVFVIDGKTKISDVIAQAGKVSLQGFGLKDLNGSTTPFPIPENGLQAIWNHLVRYVGGGTTRTGHSFPVRSNGDYFKIGFHSKRIYAQNVAGAEPR